MKDVFITKIAKFLPNAPVGNDEIGKRIGCLNGSERIKNLILRRNGIKTRYYAIDASNNVTHSNAELTFEAIKGLLDEDFVMQDIELLSSGTSSPDQFVPSHAVMVHGLMNKNTTMEVNSVSGNCSSGMNALKYAFMAVRLGMNSNAVVTGSERVSTRMLQDKFKDELKNGELERKPVLAFNKEFLRWMLSDGAGAIKLQNEKDPNSAINLKIDWIEGISYANEIETCMYAGADKREDGSLKPWSDFSTQEWIEKSVFSVKQDVKLLDKYIINKGVQSMKAIIGKYGLKPEDIDYFLPHISSFYFKDKLMDGLKNASIDIPEEKWFINLDKVGNVGAGSIFLALDGLVNNHGVKKGDKILLSVPESARFYFIYCLVTVV